MREPAPDHGRAAPREDASNGLEGAVNAGRKAAVRSIISTFAGVKFITVPLAHYLGLVAVGGGAKAEAGPVSMAQLAARAGSPIYLDPEVADFLYAEIGHMTLEQAREACAARFGANRTPSRSAINRYWQRVRRREDAMRKGQP